MKEKIIWITGLVLFSAMICWMFFDIMSRETNFGDREKVLVMGTNAGFKPFEYRENGEIVGFDVDLAREIAKGMGRELKIEDMSFDGLLPALESGKIDMAVAGMTKTPERAQNALFSDAYYRSSQEIVVRKGSDIRNKYELSGKKIGVQLGTTGDTLANKIKGTKTIQFPNAPSVLQELQSGGVDAVILDKQPAEQYLANFSDLEILPQPLTYEDYAIAIKKDKVDLAKQINEELEKIKDNGTYDRLAKKYFGDSYKSHKDKMETN